jgi:MFS family permease
MDTSLKADEAVRAVDGSSGGSQSGLEENPNSVVETLQKDPARGSESTDQLLAVGQSGLEETSTGSGPNSAFGPVKPDPLPAEPNDSRNTESILPIEPTTDSDKLDKLSMSPLDAMDAEKGVSAEANESSEDPRKLTEFPEGGWRSWLAVLILWTIVGSMIGVGINLWGVFVDFWKTNQSFGPDASLFQLTFASSLAAGLSVILGPFAGRIAEKGWFRAVGVFGGVCFMLGFTMAGFATQPWHLFVTIGPGLGLGLACGFTTAVVLPSHYFSKRRGFAVGIAITGTGAFGFAFSPLLVLVMENLGWPNAMRIVGLGLGGLCTLMACFMKPRIPADVEGKFFEFKHLKRVEFWPFAIVQAFEGFWYYALFYFLPVMATSFGCTPQQSAMIVSILQISSLGGRVLLGGLFDKIGHLNGFAAAYTIATLSMFVFWPFANNFGSLAAFAAFSGVFFGGYVAMLLTAFADVMGTEDLATTTALVFFFGIIGQFAGAPISSILVDSNSTTNPDGTKMYNWIPMIMWAGASMVPGVFALVWLRFRETGWKWKGVV